MIYIISIAIPVALLLTLRFGYRLPWWRPNEDQRCVDLWTFTHFCHGLGFYTALKTGLLLSGASALPYNLVIVTMLLEFCWELWENSQLGIRQQHSWGYPRYRGDSVLNSLFDLFACILGALSLAWFW
ncbi:hypothetical protein LCGC14_0326130 [marine sediment metagenome]|uniref:VanZ-like domain-containing protein n=1 Tax=marine sediment metagenome TaxID=412755 RepID=A0A0F9U0K6_9ZZZZ